MNTRFNIQAAGLLNRLLLLLSLAILPALFDVEGVQQPLVNVTVTPDTLLVGDRIHCTINVQHEKGVSVSLDGIDAVAVKPFELVSSRHSSSVAGAAPGEDLFELDLALFVAGKQALPSFTVVLRDTSGQVTGQVSYKPSSSVYVRELTDASMRDIRPIKPPLSPPIPFLMLMPLLLGAFGVGVLVLLLIYFLKRTVRSSAEKVDSSQVAQRKIRKLGSSLSAGMPPHECYEELSNIMRSFLETHYRISALEAVTQEIERDLKKLGVAGFESIMNLLKQADLVKFADSRPDAEESRQSLNKATEVIRSTRKSPPPVE